MDGINKYDNPTERRESESEYKRNIIEAVKSGNVDQIIVALTNVNKILTASEQGHFQIGTGINKLREELLKFFKEAKRFGDSSIVVYLGDGGISRLVISIDEQNNVKVEPTSGSSNAVKIAWEQLQ